MCTAYKILYGFYGILLFGGFSMLLSIFLAAWVAFNKKD